MVDNMVWKNCQESLSRHWAQQRLFHFSIAANKLDRVKYPKPSLGQKALNQHTFGSNSLSLVSVNVSSSVVAGFDASTGAGAGASTLVSMSLIFSAHSVLLSRDKIG